MMKIVRDIVLKKLDWLKALDVKLKRVLCNAQDDALRISYSHGKAQYSILEAGEKGPGTYLRKKDLNRAKKIAQRDYDRTLEKEVAERINKLEKILELCQMEELTKIYDDLPMARKQLVEPRILTDDEYAKKWEGAEYKGKTVDENATKLYTEKGHIVRSKSEKIIADKLYSMKIPYRYEEPLNLKGFGVVYPDFKVLNKRERREIYWEHFGRMDDPDYSEKAVRKINTYIKNGFYPGKNLILTFETSECPLDVKVIENIIRSFLV